jgi:hypothetical protein
MECYSRYYVKGGIEGMDTLVQCNNCQCKHNNRELFENGGFCLLDNIQLYNGMCICAEAELPNKWIKKEGD